MKQKIVMKLSVNDAKSRTKALKIAVGLPGVTSATLEDVDSNRMVIVGEGVDSIQLTTLLRKKMGFTELESVSKVDEKKEKEEKEKEKSSDVVAWAAYQPAYQPQYVYYVDAPSQDNCSIM